MNQFFGICGAGIEPDVAARCHSLVDSSLGAAAVDEFSSDEQGLRLVLGRAEPFSRASFGRESEADCVIVGSARLYNREELYRQLSVKSSGAEGDLELALRGYRKWGEAFCRRLVGDFAFVVWDGRKRKLLLGRDQIGVKALYYSFEGGRLSFSSSYKRLLDLLDGRPEPDSGWVADRLFELQFTDTRCRTFYRGVEQVPAACCLVFSDIGLKLVRYWKLDPFPTVGSSDSTACLVERFREILLEAVRCRLGGGGPTAFEASGGLDSNSILAASLAVGFPSEKSKLFTHGVDGGLGILVEDEYERARRSARGLGFAEPLKLCSPDGSFIEFLSSAARGKGAPMLNNWALFSRQLFKAAQASGSEVLLSGGGGDDLASNQGGAVYAEWARRLRFGKLVGELMRDRRMKSNRARLRGLLSVCCHALLPLPLRAKFLYRDRSLGEHFMSQSFMDSHPMAERVRSEGQAVYRMGFRERMARRATDGFLSYVRLPETCEMAAEFGLEVSYPMLDTRLLEFCIALPFELFRAEGYGRFALRRSLPELPPEVRWGHLKDIGAIPWPAEFLWNSRSEICDFLERAKCAAPESRWIALDAVRSAIEGEVPLAGPLRSRMMQAISLLAAAN